MSGNMLRNESVCGREEVDGTFLHESERFRGGVLRIRKGIAPTLRANKHSAGVVITKGGGSQMIINGKNVRIRKLTPKEAWRLMAFDDKDYEACKEAGISNTQLYKQAG